MPSNSLTSPLTLDRFEPTTGNIDWLRVAAANVSKIERDGDLKTLQKFLPDTAVGRVDEAQIEATPTFINAFRMSQLQVQYILHCHQVHGASCLPLLSMERISDRLDPSIHFLDMHRYHLDDVDDSFPEP